MTGTSRKYKRNQEKVTQGQLTEAQKRLPSGKIMTVPIKGTFLTLPLLAWCSQRQLEGTPLVMLGLALLRNDKMHGILHVELPIYEGETDLATVAVLETYGWQGDIWRMGAPNWPTGDEEQETHLISMMETSGLNASLVFPPREEGFPAQEVEVMRATGSFLMPPLPKVETVDPVKLQKLKDLCSNPNLFFNPLN